MKRIIEMDVMADLASAIIERQWDRTHTTPHTVIEENGDYRYVEEAQDEFNEVLDIIDETVNGDES